MNPSLQSKGKAERIILDDPERQKKINAPLTCRLVRRCHNFSLARSQVVQRIVIQEIAEMLRFAAPIFYRQVLYRRGFATRTFAPMHRAGCNALAAMALVALVSAFLSCGSGSNSSTGPQIPPNIAGSWELIAVSNTGSVTGIEVALTEGQVLDGGIEVPNGQISASSAQIAFVSLATVSQNLNITGFGGGCGATASSVNSLGPGTVSANNTVAFTFTENGNVFNVTTTLGSGGTTMVNGTYTPQSGNACSDPGGTITGTLVSVPSGTYTGQMCPLADSTSCSNQSDDVNAAVSGKSGQLTLNLNLSGTDNTDFSLTGPYTGNSFLVRGTFEGQPVTYYGYFEQVYNNTLQINVQSVYLISAADSCFSNSADTCTTATVLSVPQNP
jgi:hypothetical protein